MNEIDVTCRIRLPARLLEVKGRDSCPSLNEYIKYSEFVLRDHFGRKQ